MVGFQSRMVSCVDLPKSFSLIALSEYFSPWRMPVSIDTRSSTAAPEDEPPAQYHMQDRDQLGMQETLIMCTSTLRSLGTIT